MLECGGGGMKIPGFGDSGRIDVREWPLKAFCWWWEE
jgi:hypothetical protein